MHLAVSGPMVEQWLGVSGPAARMAIRELADRGILVPLSLPASKPGRPQWWVAGGILDAMGWAG
ncbi:MAG TPA: hypothetical protein VFW71_03140 [Actinomycetota bacterium]|nr:hypothetical protein [Actinomycetota bacterium]